MGRVPEQRLGHQGLASSWNNGICHRCMSKIYSTKSLESTAGVISAKAIDRSGTEHIIMDHLDGIALFSSYSAIVCLEQIIGAPS